MTIVIQGILAEIMLLPMFSILVIGNIYFVILIVQSFFSRKRKESNMYEYDEMLYQVEKCIEMESDKMQNTR